MQGQDAQLCIETLREATDLLRLCKIQTRVKTLRGIANARMGLAAAADVINACISDTSQRDHPGSRTDPERRLIMKEAMKLCASTKNEEVPLFLLKHLVRKFGMQTLHQLEGVKELKWLDSVVKTKERGSGQVGHTK